MELKESMCKSENRVLVRPAMMVVTALVTLVVCFMTTVGNGAPQPNVRREEVKRSEAGNSLGERGNIGRSAIPALWHPPDNDHLCYMERSENYDECDTLRCVSVGKCKDRGEYCSLVRRLLADVDRFYEWCTGCTCTHVRTGL